MDATATKVLIRGGLFSHAEKAPFTPSGHSIFGAIEVKEDESKIKCHECGEWLRAVNARHLAAHNLSAKEYQTKHGLRLKSSLSSPATRLMRSRAMKSVYSDPEARERIATQIRKATPAGVAASRHARANCRLEAWAEGKNLRMNCRAQLTVRLTNLAAKLGRTPTKSEMAAGDEHGRIWPETIEWAFRMKAREALRAIGLIPNNAGKQRIAAPTELAILQLRSRGMSYGAIAAALQIGRRTASRYANRG